MIRAESIEGIYNFFDTGYLREVFIRSLGKQIKMGAKAFILELIHARGFSQLTPPAYENLVQEFPNALTIDLREEWQFDNSHIPGAISHPFDDFLGAVLTADSYGESLSRPLILVCDTGHMSRVAGSILSEAGFTNLYSLDRGMRRMRRWYRLKQILDDAEKSRCPLCYAMAQTFGPG